MSREEESSCTWYSKCVHVEKLTIHFNEHLKKRVVAFIFMHYIK